MDSFFKNLVIGLDLKECLYFSICIYVFICMYPCIYYICYTFIVIYPIIYFLIIFFSILHFFKFFTEFSDTSASTPSRCSVLSVSVLNFS